MNTRNLIASVEFSDTPSGRRAVSVRRSHGSLDEAEWAMRAFESAMSEHSVRPGHGRQDVRLADWWFAGWVEDGPVPPEGAVLGTTSVLDDDRRPLLSDDGTAVTLCLRVRDLDAASTSER